MNPVVGGDGAPETSSAAAKKHQRRPKYSQFTQQELPACKPILTPGWAIAAFVSIAILFIPIGILSLSASESVVEMVKRYDKDCIPSGTESSVAYIQNPNTTKTCFMNFIVPKKMKRPIYVYYQLDNFYQNHRRYVRSRNDNQLRSKAYEDETKGCGPEAKTNDSGRPIIVPCGLIAWSLFNDTYEFSLRDQALNVSKKDIAWESDRKYKFGSNVYPKNFQTGNFTGGAKLNETISLSEQMDLMVWMRTAALPTFRKLYGKIEVDLEAHSNISVVIQNNYNTYNFSGKKNLILSTTTWIGGKNDFIGIAYLIVGGLSLFTGISFLLLYLINPRPLGDPSYLSWNMNPNCYSYQE